jgi:hypothetical protein
MERAVVERPTRCPEACPARQYRFRTQRARKATRFSKSIQCVRSNVLSRNWSMEGGPRVPAVSTSQDPHRGQGTNTDSPRWTTLIRNPRSRLALDCRLQIPSINRAGDGQRLAMTQDLVMATATTMRIALRVKRRAREGVHATT